MMIKNDKNLIAKGTQQLTLEKRTNSPVAHRHLLAHKTG